MSVDPLFEPGALGGLSVKVTLPSGPTTSLRVSLSGSTPVAVAQTCLLTCSPLSLTKTVVLTSPDSAAHRRWNTSATTSVCLRPSRTGRRSIRSRDEPNF